MGRGNPKDLKISGSPVDVIQNPASSSSIELEEPLPRPQAQSSNLNSEQRSQEVKVELLRLLRGNPQLEFTRSTFNTGNSRHPSGGMEFDQSERCDKMEESCFKVLLSFVSCLDRHNIS